ncbi:TIGR01777 family oxidoreductase [Echinicola jeungdonensis]|uniref:TIGR01777 family oxidoreductase n=1 Tax=Echinicola jeungdonensis TaxID=709343 RepID=A0ABV5JAF3_9BACT|nr:TIGR01777 family oxidoreductase [Echinicola jeungdonensis]MDN3669456.1 TIGR01777 family oxidoreductase [Echinicola jeungdonensis]
MKNILITGGSGMIGQKLTKQLESNQYQVAWLSRTPDQNSHKSFFWDITEKKVDQKALEWCDAIVHLAGAGVAEKRWTPARKKQILDSRVDTAQLLFDHFRAMEKRPEVVVSASGANYYGLDNGYQILNEDSPAGNDFLAQVAKKWEETILQFEKLGARTVCLRTGIVLDRDGGALEEILKPPITAPVGSGNQIMSWIHIQDLVNLYQFALEEKNVSGCYNAATSSPASNKAFTQVASRIKGKPFIPLPVPGFALKLFLGELAGVVLGGNHISPDKIISAGFKFKHVDLNEALMDIYGKK